MIKSMGDPSVGPSAERSAAVDAVIFDFDDTLVASRTVRRAALTSTIRSLGRTVSDEGFAVAYGRSLRELVDAIDPGCPFEEFLPAYVDTVRASPAPLLPGARELLEHLAASGIRRSIVSASHADLIRIELEVHGIEDLVEQVIGTAGAPPVKPDPLVLVRACEGLGTSPSTSLYVGDSLADLRMAAAAGVGFVGVCTGTVSFEEFERHAAALPVPVTICAGLTRGFPAVP
jgi:HAD superfamily hydrolase (TIGR01509 family)